MLDLRIEEVDNGYVVSALPEQREMMYRTQHVAIDVRELGLLIKQLAGAEKDRRYKARRKS